MPQPSTRTYVATIGRRHLHTHVHCCSKTVSGVSLRAAVAGVRAWAVAVLPMDTRLADMSATASLMKLAVPRARTADRDPTAVLRPPRRFSLSRAVHPFCNGDWVRSSEVVGRLVPTSACWRAATVPSPSAAAAHVAPSWLVRPATHAYVQTPLAAVKCEGARSACRAQPSEHRPHASTAVGAT